MTGSSVNLNAKLSYEEHKVLRQQAEERLSSLPADPIATKFGVLPHPLQHLLTELQVYQIELEMQNEELRRTQSELDKSRVRHLDFYDLAPVGYCTVGEDGLFRMANLTVATMFGTTPKKLIGQPFHRFLMREDQDVMYLFRRELIDSKKSSGCELRLILSDGTTPWYQLIGIAATDQDGIITLRYVLSDITERKRNEAKLRLTSNVFTHTREGIAITDAQGTIVEVNDAFTDITGYRRDEALGKNPRILKSNRHSAAFYQKFWEELRRTGYWTGEIWNRRKNGEVYAELLTISAVCDDQGQVQQYVSLFSDISKLKAHEQHLDHLAHFDSLTNLPNRLLAADRMNQAMAHARRSGQGLAVVYIDLDGFKRINDHFGHEVGDQLLINVATQMQHVLREGDTLARLGGDEFVAILIDESDINICAATLDRLLTAVVQPMAFQDKMLRVSASLGVTFYPQNQEVDVEGCELLRQADLAMYKAKTEGKNCYRVFDVEQMSPSSQW